MKKYSLFSGYLVIAAALSIGINAQANTIVFVNEPGLGSQQNFVLGMDFVVHTAVTVTELGAFDSGGGGFSDGISVGIFDLTSQSLLGSSATIIGTAGTLIGGSRFVSVTPFTLNPGTYSIVAAGWALGGPDLSGNTGLGTPPGMTSFNSDGGAISMVTQGGRWQNGTDLVFPTANTGGHGQPDPEFQAGTFAVSELAVPDGGMTIGLLGMALAGLAMARNRFARA